ncbi:DMT family transporter [bacterium]|nr:DMT family transporter [bacterium]
MSKSRSLLYFCLVVLAWGGSFLGIHYSLEHFPPFLAAFFRSAVCFLAVAAFMIFKKLRFRYGRYSLYSAGIGMIGMGLAWIFLFWGEMYIPPALASIINSTVPIFIVILTPFLTPQDKLTPQKIIGVLVGFSGVLVIFWPNIASLSVSPSVLGMTLIFGMAASYGSSILVVRRLLKHIEPTANIFYQSIGAMIILWCVSFSLEKEAWARVDWSLHTGLLAVAYLGIVASAMAFVLFNQIIKHVGSIQAGMVTLCVPFVSIILDMIILKSFLNFYQMAGGLLILLSLGIINNLLAFSWKPREAATEK